MAYLKDNDRTRTGFATFDEASTLAKRIRSELNDLPEVTYRVRVRARSRTGMWDVVVKVKQPEKDAA